MLFDCSNKPHYPSNPYSSTNPFHIHIYPRKNSPCNRKCSLSRALSCAQYTSRYLSMVILSTVWYRFGMNCLQNTADTNMCIFCSCSTGKSLCSSSLPNIRSSRPSRFEVFLWPLLNWMMWCWLDQTRIFLLLNLVEFLLQLLWLLSNFLADCLVYLLYFHMKKCSE